MSDSTTSHELPLLGGISSFFRWIESLVTIASGPILTVGLGIALVDLLTDGSLLASQPLLLYVWAFSQALGVDSQLVASFDRARVALRERRHWAFIGSIALGLVLCYVAWIAAQTFAVQQADHLTTTQALASIGLDRTTWLVQRSALSVALVALSGWFRYHPPVKVRLSLEEELDEIERATKVAAARQGLREQQAVGATRLGRSLLAAAQGRKQEENSTPDPLPTGPGSPTASSAENSSPDESSSDTGSNNIATLPVESKRRQTGRHLSPVARISAEEGLRRRAFELLEREPGISVSRLARTLHVRWEKADALARAYRRQASNVAL
jgi:hypothetical protein